MLHPTLLDDVGPPCWPRLNGRVKRILNSLCQCGYSDNNNKISLLGMQLPEKYKAKFDVSSEGPSSGS